MAAGSLEAGLDLAGRVGVPLEAEEASGHIDLGEQAVEETADFLG